MLELLRERGVEFDTIEYLKTPLDRPTLSRIIDAIDDAPADLVRKDNRFKELGLDASDYTTKSKVVALLLEHPELMQRPVVVVGKRTIIARPKEKVLDLLDLR